MIEWILKGTLLLGLLAGLVTALRGGSAAARRSLLATGIVGALALPLLPTFVPLWGHSSPAEAVPSSDEIGVTAPAAWTTPTAAATPDASLRAAAAANLGAAPGAGWLLGLWLAGSMLLLVRLALDHRRVARLWARSGHRPAPAAWQRALDGLGATEVRWSPEITTPMVVGVLRPALLLPESARDLPEARAAACVAHERAHLSGHDTRLILLADVLRVLRWPDPLTWWAARRLRAECEHTADDAVLATGTHRADYAELLLTLASGPRTPLTAAVGAGGLGAEHRIDRVLRTRTRPTGRHAAARAGAAGVFLAAAIGCAGPGEPAEASPLPAVVEGVALRQPVVGRDEIVQAKIEEELLKFQAEAAPVAASVVVVEVETGRVLALAGAGPQGDETPLRPVEPASTLKPFAIAAALESGLDRDARFDTAGGRVAVEGHTFRDAHPAGVLDLEDILVHSSNAGAALVAQAVGAAELRDALARFHLAPPADVEFTPLRAALATSGAGLQATPVQIALAYATLANDGIEPSTGERAVSSETAAAVREMLEAVVERGTGQGALVEDLRIGGKTGTMDAVGADGRPLTRASFVGLFPLDAPRWVVHVQVDTRAPGATGGQTAAPIFGRIAASLVRGC